MVGEVLMDLLQPEIMSRIVDDGVLGLHNGGISDMNLIWTMGLQMAGIALVGGLCGSLNNVFVHIASQNMGNEMRKDAFRNIMTFSFPQVDAFGTGSLVTRMTNDVTQVQNYIAQFFRGMIRTSMLMFGSIFFHVPPEQTVRADCAVRLSDHRGLYGLLSEKGQPVVRQAAGAAGRDQRHHAGGRVRHPHDQSLRPGAL